MDKILVIDDAKFIRTIAGFNLNKFGFDVITARSGQIGLALAKKEQPALILLDVMMPGEDGFQVLTELKSGERTKKTPVIMLTARSRKEDIIRAMKLGAIDYVAKPFDVNILMGKIRRVIPVRSAAIPVPESASAAGPGAAAPAVSKDTVDS